MSKNSGDTTPEKSEPKTLEDERQAVKKGDFFFAAFLVGPDDVRRSPVFIISNDNDPLDVIACKCTSQPPRSELDVRVTLKKETYVRTNKIYTFPREQLLFRISQQAIPEELERITVGLRKALGL